MKGRLIIASNRLPIVLTKEGKDWKVEEGTGGLVTALVPVLKNRGGIWIGWPGTTGDREEIEEVISGATRDSGYRFGIVHLEPQEIDGFYYGFANEILWPLFHDLQTHCNFDPSYWDAYIRVNRKFAAKIAENYQRGDYIWIHDYHLMAVARELRRMGIDSETGFFLHIPFPSLDIFLKLPWRFQILKALLHYDLIGFQTVRDRTNFVQCVKTLFKDITIQGRGRVLKAFTGEREVGLGVFPISIDFHAFARKAISDEVAKRAWYIHEDLPNRHLILGIDRLDYTKGIPHKLQAYKRALLNFPDLRRKVTLIQVVVPSRKRIPRYEELKTQIDRLVGEINGEFTESGWVPVHYIFRRLSTTELLAYYRTSEIALITPLKDGMNLVAKEYCAANVDENGVLILSEFAGAASQLHRWAILVNPYDVEGVAEAIYRAFTMPGEERQRRMKALRRSIREYDIYWWVDSFLRAGIARDLRDFPLMEEYIPQEVKT